MEESVGVIDELLRVAHSYIESSMLRGRKKIEVHQREMETMGGSLLAREAYPTRKREQKRKKKRERADRHKHTHTYVCVSEVGIHESIWDMTGRKSRRQ